MALVNDCCKTHSHLIYPMALMDILHKQRFQSVLSVYVIDVCKFSVLNLTTLLIVWLCFCFVALHSKSTAMVMAGQSILLTTLFPGQA